MATKRAKPAKKTTGARKPAVVAGKRASAAKRKTTTTKTKTATKTPATPATRKPRAPTRRPLFVTPPISAVKAASASSLTSKRRAVPHRKPAARRDRKRDTSTKAKANRPLAKPIAKPTKRPLVKPAKPIAKPIAKRPIVKPAKRQIVKPTKRPIAKPAKRPTAPAPKPKKPTKAQLAARERELARQRLARNAARRAAQAEARAIDEARRAKRNERARERRRLAKLPPDSPELVKLAAIDWLERMRDDFARVFRCSLTISRRGGGSGDLAISQGPDAALLADGAYWLIIGRFDPEEEIGYQTLARGLDRVIDDYVLEAAINPDRLSQIRIVFSDVNSQRGEGDSIVSRIGAWTFITGDIMAELVGSNIDNPDSDSLAGRYDQSTVPQFYVYFSSETRLYQTASPWATTATVARPTRR